MSFNNPDTDFSNSDCGNCIYHGFPCLNCAGYEYAGSLGPGYMDQQLWICQDYDPEVQVKMREVAESNGLEYKVLPVAEVQEI